MAGYAEILPFPTMPIMSTAQIVHHGFQLDDCCVARCLVHHKDKLVYILTHVCSLSAHDDGEVMVHAYLISFLDQLDTGAMQLFNRCHQHCHKMEDSEVPSFQPYKMVLDSAKSMADPLSLHAIAVMNNIHRVLFDDCLWCTCIDGDVDKCNLILVCLDDGTQCHFISVMRIDGQLTARKKEEVHKFCQDLLQKYQFSTCSAPLAVVPPRTKALAAIGVAPPSPQCQVSHCLKGRTHTTSRARASSNVSCFNCSDRSCSPQCQVSHCLKGHTHTTSGARVTLNVQCSNCSDRSCSSPPDVRSCSLVPECYSTRSEACHITEAEATTAHDTDELSSDNEPLGPITHAFAREHASQRAQAAYGATLYMVDEHSDNIADNLNDDNMTTYVCGECDAVKDSKLQLHAHIFRHHKGYLYTAPHCMAVCRSEHQQCQHYASHHQAGNYSCTDCRKKFVHLSKLHEHLITHDETPVMYRCNCPVCSLEFSHHHDLRRYMQKYEGEDHVCHDCGKKFKEKHHLAQYELKHADPKIQCHHCNEKFKSYMQCQCHEAANH